MSNLVLVCLNAFLATFKNFYLFIYPWLCWVFVAVRAFSSCGEQGLLQLQFKGFSLSWHLLLQSVCSRGSGSTTVSCGLSIVAPRF